MSPPDSLSILLVSPPPEALQAKPGQVWGRRRRGASLSWPLSPPAWISLAATHRMPRLICVAAGHEMPWPDLRERVVGLRRSPAGGGMASMLGGPDAWRWLDGMHKATALR